MDSLLSDTTQLALTDDLTKKTRLGTEANRQTLGVQRILAFMVLGVFSGFLCYLIGSVIIARKTYSRAATLIDNAISQGLYTGPGGTRTVFAFHLGRLGAFLCGFDNVNLPDALVIMCYEKQWEAVFAEKGIENWFQCIHDIAIRNSSLTAAQIFCTALDCSRGQSIYNCPINTLCPNVVSCLPACNPTAYIQMDTSTSIMMAGLNGAFTGAGAVGTAAAAFATVASGPVGLIGALIGGLVGGILGSSKAIEESKAIHYQCVSMRKNCVMVANAPACGGYD